MLTLCAWVAAAQDVSAPAAVVFDDELLLFPSVTIDTGWLPSDDSAVAVRFLADPAGGVYSRLAALSELSWSQTFQQGLLVDEDGGELGIDAGILFDFDAKIDVTVWSGTLDIWDTTFWVSEYVGFDSLGLPGSPDEQVQVVVDDVGRFQPFSTSIAIIPGVSLDIALDARPEFTATLDGRYVTTGQPGQPTAIQDAEGAFIELPIPDEPLPELLLDSTYVADIYSVFDLVLTPSATLDVPFTSFELASFDFTLPLVELLTERAMPSAPYAHPLPVVGELVVPAVVPVLTGQTLNLTVPIDSLGEMLLEGTARIEGSDAFRVSPAYFAATPGNTSGVVVSFAPDAVGDHVAALVIETNDPTAPFTRIPLAGVGLDPQPPNTDTVPDEVTRDRRVSTEGRGCGCQASASASAPAGWFGLLWFALSRRRSKNFTRRRSPSPSPNHASG